MANALETVTMPIGYFRLIHRGFGERFGDAALAGTGVSLQQLENPATEINLAQQVRQIELISALYGADWVFERPEIWNAAMHGAIAVAAISAPTLGDVAAVLARYAQVRAPFLKARARRSGEALLLDWELTAPLTQAQWLPMMEANFLSVRSLFQTALGRNPHELRFRFAGPAPPHWRKAELALGEPLGYDAPTNRVQIPRGWATTQSVTADARLHQNAIAELQTSLTHVHDPDYLKARVERLLQSMPEGLTDVVDAARSLGLSRRTLARRLADGGVDFRSMLDAERRERALKLKAAGFSRTEIAERLGYQDPTSFSRAWRRWRDQTAASGDPPPG